jgi:toxin ParE1/3/4
MPARIVKSRQARRDLLEHFVFLGRQSATTARRFLTAAEQTLLRLANHPGLGSLYEPATTLPVEVRFHSVGRRFRSHLVFYRELADGIEVLRVLHAAQDIETLLPQSLPANGGEPP